MLQWRFPVWKEDFSIKSTIYSWHHVKDIERSSFLLKNSLSLAASGVFRWVSGRRHYKEISTWWYQESSHNLTLSVFFFSFFFYPSVCVSASLIGTITVQCLLALLPVGPRETGTSVRVCVRYKTEAYSTADFPLVQSRGTEASEYQHWVGQ